MAPPPTRMMWSQQGSRQPSTSLARCKTVLSGLLLKSMRHSGGPWGLTVKSRPASPSGTISLGGHLMCVPVIVKDLVDAANIFLLFFFLLSDSDVSSQGLRVRPTVNTGMVAPRFFLSRSKVRPLLHAGSLSRGAPDETPVPERR